MQNQHLFSGVRKYSPLHERLSQPALHQKCDVFKQNIQQHNIILGVFIVWKVNVPNLEGEHFVCQ